LRGTATYNDASSNIQCRAEPPINNMKSMTGYGSSEGKVGRGLLFAEIRSVNSRFLDINCKLPFSMYPLEPKIKTIIQNNVIRGKIEVFVKERVHLGETVELSVNQALVRQYKKCLGEITQMLGMKTSSHLLEVVDLKELVTVKERPLDMHSLWRQIEKVIITAVRKYDSMRIAEGAALKRDQLKRLNDFSRIVSMIEKRCGIRLNEYKKRVNEHIRDGVASDAEISNLSDKLDVTEELIRLKSHISQYRSLIEKRGAVGRQIDFLLQEMHREINTLGSKASDGSMSSLVVEAKAELEKLREQVQNVE